MGALNIRTVSNRGRPAALRPSQAPQDFLWHRTKPGPGDTLSQTFEEITVLPEGVVMVREIKKAELIGYHRHRSRPPSEDLCQKQPDLSVVFRGALRLSPQTCLLLRRFLHTDRG